MATHAALFTKPNCPKCKMTRHLLERSNYSFVDTYYGNANETNVVDILSEDLKKQQWSEQKIQDLKERYNVQSMPFVEIWDDETGEMVDYWSDFKPEKIKYWAGLNNED